MNYVDGFAAAVPADKKDAYLAHAGAILKLWKEFGAIRVVECWEDDVQPGKQTDFRRAVRAEGGEKIVFSWIEWPSKSVRDVAMTKLMDDPRMKEIDMPFDGSRMIMGGFTPALDQ